MKPLLLLVFLFAGLSGTTQVIYPYRTCSLPKELRECSGLALVKPNLLAAINDGGNAPAIYFMDTTGRLLNTRKFTHLTNTDWEELFYSAGSLHIADVGDNLCQRQHLTIYHYDLERDSVFRQTELNFEEKKYRKLQEKDKHYDCEAGFFFDGYIYLFSKTHAKPYTGKSFEYRISPGKDFDAYRALDSAAFGDKGFIHNSLTGAATSKPLQHKVVFISCTHLWIKYDPDPGQYLSSGWLMDFDFAGLTQKEAVTFLDNNKLVVADERTAGLMGGRLYFYDIEPYFNGTKRYARPSVKNASLKYKKDDAYIFSFESLDPLKEISLGWVDDEGELVYLEQVPLSGNKTHREISFKNPHVDPPTAFWVTDGKKILFTSKIIQK